MCNSKDVSAHYTHRVLIESLIVREIYKMFFLLSFSFILIFTKIDNIL